MTENREITLIADAGSTKIEWLALADGAECARLVTDGVNALTADTATLGVMMADVAKAMPNIGQPTHIYYYGAGCVSASVCDKIREAIGLAYPNALIHVTTDLLGAARALLGTTPGIACILGTGSNSCLYNGSKIVANTPSLGYIIGDEGSGAALGKRLISDIFKGYLPENVGHQFMHDTGLTLPEILDKTYKQPNANRFLASLTPFIKDNLWNPHIYGLVIKEFSHFFRRNVLMYEDCKSLPICFTGSIAWHFAKPLHEAAASQGLIISKITQTPADGLVQYHLHNCQQ